MRIVINKIKENIYNASLENIIFWVSCIVSPGPGAINQIPIIPTISLNKRRPTKIVVILLTKPFILENRLVSTLIKIRIERILFLG